MLWLQPARQPLQLEPFTILSSNLGRQLSLVSHAGRQHCAVHRGVIRARTVHVWSLLLNAVVCSQAVDDLKAGDR